MRILGGKGRGRRLRSAAGEGTRPTGGRVRQTLFDILAPEIRGSRFLDCFAGSGGIGLEALSRGAAEVVLVERGAEAVAALRENARALAGVGGDVRVFAQDATVALAAFDAQGLRFDVVYVDPPYASQLYEPLLERLGSGGLVAEGGLVVAEHFKKRALPERIGALARTRVVRVGDHCLSFYRRRGAGEDPTPGV
jgi:16S rRNA (guanine(966)-N(2))-methyltransferase RsmD